MRVLVPLALVLLAPVGSALVEPVVPTILAGTVVHGAWSCLDEEARFTLLASNAGPSVVALADHCGGLLDRDASCETSKLGDVSCSGLSADGKAWTLTASTPASGEPSPECAAVGAPTARLYIQIVPSFGHAGRVDGLVCRA